MSALHTYCTEQVDFIDECNEHPDEAESTLPCTVLRRWAAAMFKVLISGWPQSLFRERSSITLSLILQSFDKETHSSEQVLGAHLLLPEAILCSNEEVEQ